MPAATSAATPPPCSSSEFYIFAVLVAFPLLVALYILFRNKAALWCRLVWARDCSQDWYGIHSRPGREAYELWHRIGVILSILALFASVIVVGIDLLDCLHDNLWSYLTFFFGFAVSILISLWTWGSAISQKEASKEVRRIVSGETIFSPAIDEQVHHVIKLLSDFHDREFHELILYLSSPAFGLFASPGLAKEFLETVERLVAYAGQRNSDNKPHIEVVLWPKETHLKWLGPESSVLHEMWAKEDWRGELEGIIERVGDLIIKLLLLRDENIINFRMYTSVETSYRMVMCRAGDRRISVLMSYPAPGSVEQKHHAALCFIWQSHFEKSYSEMYQFYLKCRNVNAPIDVAPHNTVELVRAYFGADAVQRPAPIIQTAATKSLDGTSQPAQPAASPT